MFVNLGTMPLRNTIRYMRPAFLSLFAAIATLALIAACGGDDGDSTETPNNVLTPIASDLLPTVISSDLAVGENRFSVGLLNQAENGAVVTGADLHFAFYSIDESGNSTLKFEMEPRALVIDRAFTHLHEDGEIHVHEGGATGAYVAYPTFDSAGNWGVEVTGTADGVEMNPVRLAFNVLEEHFSLTVGDPAPASEQTVLADVDDIAEIDTSEVPIPEQHEMTIADAVTSGKPTVVAFATPAFCTSQICGPVKELFDDLYDEYKDDANFVHVEPYDIACVRGPDFQDLFSCAVPTVAEWELQSEPWVYIVDADGTIAAAFDGISSYEEMQAALEQVL
jgi:hypothetical protein